jgi:Cu-processing system permease protein
MKNFRLRTIQLLAMTKFVTQQAAFERYFYGLALTGLLGLGLSVVLSNLAVAGEMEVLTHMTLSLTELFGMLVVLTMGPKLIIDAMTNRQVYLLFSRPMPRWLFVLGTYLGLLVFIGLCTLALGGVSTFLRFTQGGEFNTVWFASFGTIFLSLMTLAAAAMFFSTFSSKLLSAFFTFGLFMGGNGLSLILQYAERHEGLHRFLLNTTAKLLPNFEKLNLKMAAVYNLDWMTSTLGMAVVNCLAWQAVFVFAAVVIFRNRNLK